MEMAISGGDIREGRVAEWMGFWRWERATSEWEYGEGKWRFVDGRIEKGKGDEWMGVKE